MTNIELAKKALHWAHEHGVRDIVICPGARCAPLIEVLEQNKDFQIQSHFDERSAGFYALGLIQSSNRPVAVITTSGTAVSELMSPVIEAHYNELPLMVLSTDRPKSYRGSGAPQTIDQASIFSNFVEFSVDEDRSQFESPNWSLKKPVHFNLCFDEPLIHGEVQPWSLSKSEFKAQPEVHGIQTEISLMKKQLGELKNPLVIVSGSYGFPKDLVQKTLKDLQMPIFLESTSGLKGHKSLSHLEVKFPERLIQEKKIESVIRIGHIPTNRLWRDLEFTRLPVLSLSHKSFSGLSWTKDVFPISEENLFGLKNIIHNDVTDLLKNDQVQIQKVNHALAEFPLSEGALISKLRSYWNPSHLVFLGNSLPIREWDLISLDGRCDEQVVATRGANGIDGQISTFYGLSKNSTHPNLGVFGDLTTLYDMNAPWLLGKAPLKNYVAVINNSGGKIFDRMFKSPLFQNQHQMNFKNWAATWDLPYQQFEAQRSPFGGSGGVIEVTPDAQHTQKFLDFLK